MVIVDNATKIYAPSPTETFSFCHLKWELEKQRWVPNRMGKRELSKYVGRAFADGLASFRHLAATKPDDRLQPDSPIELAKKVALSSFTCEIGALLTAGVEIETQDVDELRAALERGLDKFATDDPLAASKGWKVQDIELSLPDHGNARIDWGGLDPYGVLCQVDYKLKLNLDDKPAQGKPNWYNKEVERYRYSWQMQHYCWAYGEYLHQPCSRYYVCLIVLAPRFSARTHQWEIDPELQAAWLTSARQKWSDMYAQTADQRVPDMAAIHRDAYGDCVYQQACLEHKLDPGLMRTKYVQLTPREVQ